MKPSIQRQRGISLVGVLLVAVVLFIGAVLGTKVAPDVIEYAAILKNVKSTAHDPGLAGASVSQVRDAFQKRVLVEGSSSIGAEDIEITKEGSEIVIAFAYSKKIPLFANVSLVIDFQGSSK